MPTRRTPPLSIRGKFTVTAPFTVVSGAVYTCIALRKFSDISNAGENVLKDYYEPNGLTSTEYQADKDVGAVIVTLISDTDDVIYIPDTYIASFPDVNIPEYQRMILMVDLGVVPYSMPTTVIKSDIASVITDRLGIASPTITEGVTAFTGTLTLAEADTLETARQAAITNTKTDKEIIDDLTTSNAELAARNAALMQIIIDLQTP